MCVWVWKAGKCDRNKCCIVTISHNSMQGLCDDRWSIWYYTTWWLHIYTGRGQEYKNSVPPLFSFPWLDREWKESRKKMKEREREESDVIEITALLRNVWYTLRQWRQSATTNVCVCLIKQLWLFHLTENTEIEPMFQCKHYVSLFFMLKNHKQQSVLIPFS